MGKRPGHPILVGNGSQVAFTVPKPGPTTEGELTLMDARSGDQWKWCFPVSTPVKATGKWNEGPYPEGVSLSPDER